MKNPPRSRKRSQSISQESTPKAVQLSYHAPDARQVFVAGTFNEWKPDVQPLRREKDGLWLTDLSLAPGTYEYLFVVDEQWVRDPRSAGVPNPFGGENSVLVVEMAGSKTISPMP